MREHGASDRLLEKGRRPTYVSVAGGSSGGGATPAEVLSPAAVAAISAAPRRRRRRPLLRRGRRVAGPAKTGRRSVPTRGARFRLALHPYLSL